MKNKFYEDQANDQDRQCINKSACVGYGRKGCLAEQAEKPLHRQDQDRQFKHEAFLHPVLKITRSL